MGRNWVGNYEAVAPKLGTIVHTDRRNPRSSIRGHRQDSEAKHRRDLGPASSAPRFGPEGALALVQEFEEGGRQALCDPAGVVQFTDVINEHAQRCQVQAEY